MRNFRRFWSYYLSTNPRHAIIGPVRAVFRLYGFVIAFLAMSVYVVARRALLPRSLRDAGGPEMRRFVGRVISAAVGARICRSGAERSHLSPMIVCNHISWLDAFILAAETGARFVAASSWEAIPVLGTVLRAGGNLFIDRRQLQDTRMIGGRIGVLIGRGERILVFAEAGTSRGTEVIPFRAALLEPAARTGIPVSWAALRYETPPGWPPAGVVMGWPDWTPIVLHIYRAFHVPRVRAELIYGRVPIVADNRKTLAQELHTAVSAKFFPLDQPSPEEMARIECPYSRWND